MLDYGDIGSAVAGRIRWPASQKIAGFVRSV